VGLDSTTLFFAIVVILAVSTVAYAWVWLRGRDERYWFYWISSNLTLTAALAVYAALPRLSAQMSIWPDALMLLGLAQRLMAARAFGGRPALTVAACAPAVMYLAFGLVVDVPGLNFVVVNALLALLAGTVAAEFWRDRADNLPSRHGLVAIYLLLVVSFAVRAAHGLPLRLGVLGDMPEPVMLEINLLMSMIHAAVGAALVLSIAFERRAASLMHAALLDPLTGLPNRRAFETALRRRVAEGPQERFALALLDVDFFKRVNDRYGHAAGDLVLCRFANACSSVLQPGDQIYRIGGEEFALIVQAAAAPEAHAIVERVRHAASNCATRVEGDDITITASAGLCHSSSVARDFDALLEAADAQLYHAKHHGRNQTASAAGEPDQAGGGPLISTPAIALGNR
jgi:diguanylate cyclase (GGDEF)-like protein